MFKSLLRPAGVLFGALTVITGLIYPLVIAGVARVAFADRAAGSLVSKNGAPVGSALIGQHFESAEYFWGRPSATGSHPYNALASGGSNLGPLNPALVDAVRERIARLRAADPSTPAPVPIDLVTASASGLDPHISVAAARYQAARISLARAVPRPAVDRLIDAHSHGRVAGFLGEPTVNVLEINLALDALPPRSSSP